MSVSAARDEPVGVLGGLGPAATVHFMHRLVELTDAHRDQDHVDLLVWQHGSIPDRSAFLLGHGDSPEPVLVADAVALERAGARFIAIPCNTAVVWVDQMRAAVSIDVLDTVAETVDAARAGGPGAAAGSACSPPTAPCSPARTPPPLPPRGSTWSPPRPRCSAR